MAKKVLVSLDLTKNEIQNVLIHKLAAAPGSPVEGMIFTNTSATHDMEYYNGTEWVSMDAKLRTGIPIGNLATNPLARANHTGTQLAATISDFDTQVRTSRLDQMAVPTASVSMNSQKITNLLAPTAGTDAVNKTYADNLALGLRQRFEVKAATIATAGTYNATGGTSTRGQLTACPNTLDGVTLAANDRILVKNHSTGAANGIYVVSTLGTGANGVWDRADDADADGEITSSTFVFVGEGSTQADTGWTVSTNGAIVVGGGSGTSIAFTQFSGGAGMTAGGGLTKTGNTFDVGAGTGIIVNADDVAIDTAVVVRKYASDIGDGSSTAITVTHSLGTRDVVVEVFNNSTPWDTVECDVTRPSTTQVTCTFAVAPTSAQYRVTIKA
jgi:hypothetical protein